MTFNESTGVLGLPDRQDQRHWVRTLTELTKALDPTRPVVSNDGWETLTPSDKELLKWVGVFFRKPTPGKFMMRIRMPNGFASSEQLAAIADVSKRLGNGTLDITTRQQIELRGYTI